MLLYLNPGSCSSIPGDYEFYAGKYYKYNGNNLNQKTAKESCQANQAWLVMPKTRVEFEAGFRHVAPSGMPILKFIKKVIENHIMII